MPTFALRPVQDDDHEWLCELHNDPEVLRNLTHPTPITLEHHMAWWNSIKDDPKQQREIFMVDGIRVGFVKFYYIDPVNSNCVLGADIHSQFRGRGYAKHMWSLMLDKCFGEMFMHRVGLSTSEFNTIARRVYVGLGFKDEGRQVEAIRRDGRYWDGICMYMLRHEWYGSEP